MLGQWLDIVGIEKVSVMGMSLGSVVASCFAYQRPDLIDRMVLMGVMQKTRKSWRMIWKNRSNSCKKIVWRSLGKRLFCIW
jgi:pimeloyl-ACP methyl ester carboxylesterase